MNDFDLQVRDFRPEDADAFRSLNEEWIGRYFEMEEPDRKALLDPEGSILKPGGRIFVACAGDQVVGCCSLIASEPGAFEVAKMAVLPEWQGRGIGRRILSHTIRQARLLGAKRLHLASSSKLERAVALYESLGFVHRAPGEGRSLYARADVFLELDLRPLPEIGHTAGLLRAFPAALDALVRPLGETWTHRSEGEGTWSLFDTVGHLAHLERTDWMQRIRLTLEADAPTFSPVDRTAQTKESQGRSLGYLLDEFARLRRENVDALLALCLQPADLARRARHPRLGEVTLGQLVATWAAHDLTHLHQMARILADPYREAVGPWSQFLGVLHCTGHGS